MLRQDDSSALWFCHHVQLRFLAHSYGRSQSMGFCLRLEQQSLTALEWQLSPLEWPHRSFCCGVFRTTGREKNYDSFVSTQLLPVPTSTTRGTERVVAFSISYRTNSSSRESSLEGDSNTSSSCT